MSKHFFILFCLIPLFICSCSDDTYDFPVKVRRTNERRETKLRLFIAGKEVNNPVLMNELYNQDIRERYVGMTSCAVSCFIINFPDSICFTSQSTALVDDKYTFSVFRDKDLIQLKTAYQGSLSHGFAEFATKLLKYQPKAVYGYPNQYIIYATGHGDYNNFELSVLHYKYYSRSYSNYYAEEGTLNNELTDKLTPDTDTLLVEEYRLVYK